MVRKMKPKKKQHSFKNETDEIQPKRKKNLPKEKYRNPKLWLEDDLDELME